MSYASDPDNDALTVTAINVIVSENGGELTVHEDGRFEYVPGANSLYDDVFTVTISDGIAEVTATLTIQVTNA